MSQELALTARLLRCDSAWLQWHLHRRGQPSGMRARHLHYPCRVTAAVVPCKWQPADHGTFGGEALVLTAPPSANLSQKSARSSGRRSGLKPFKFERRISGVSWRMRHSVASFFEPSGKSMTCRGIAPCRHPVRLHPQSPLSPRCGFAIATCKEMRECDAGAHAEHERIE